MQASGEPVPWVKFFAQLPGGKRSFQLRVNDVTEKKLSLMSTFNKFYLVDKTPSSTASSAEQSDARIESDELELLQPNHTYQLFQKLPGEGKKPKQMEFEKVATIEELRSAPGRRKRLPHPSTGRDIIIFTLGNEYCAIDAVCYHFGGPLIEGDIEDIGGRTCIVCPWHKYIIDLKTGERVYRQDNAICSSGVKQRTHSVKVEGEDIYVKLSEVEEKRASDEYANMGLWKYPTSRTPTAVHSAKNT